MSLTVFYSSSIYCPTCFHDPAPYFKLDPDGGMEICGTCEHVYQYSPAPTPTSRGKQVWHISNLMFTETAAKRGYIMPGQKITEPEQLINLPVGTVLINKQHIAGTDEYQYYPAIKTSSGWDLTDDIETRSVSDTGLLKRHERDALYLLELPEQGEQQ